MIRVDKAPIQKGTKALVRCDLDIPVTNGKIQEKYRLEACLPTLLLIIQKGAFPVIIGHMGKPQGKYTKELSTQNLKPFFEKNLGQNNFELLENLRFDPREEKNSKEFAEELARKTGAGIFVNESFATCHRSHSSIVQLPKILKSYAGLRLDLEITTLTKVLQNPAKPFISIVGGAKIESKLAPIEQLKKISDFVLLGGKLSDGWQEKNTNVVRAVDSVDSKDIGPQTIHNYAQKLATAKTVLWSGPMGVYEEEKYLRGTKEIAEKIVKSGCFSVIGGGDTIAALDKIGLLSKISFASTGGGAMLEFICNKNLPGIAALG